MCFRGLTRSLARVVLTELQAASEPWKRGGEATRACLREFDLLCSRESRFELVNSLLRTHRLLFERTQPCSWNTTKSTAKLKEPFEGLKLGQKVNENVCLFLLR